MNVQGRAVRPTRMLAASIAVLALLAGSLAATAVSVERTQRFPSVPALTAFPDGIDGIPLADLPPRSVVAVDRASLAEADRSGEPSPSADTVETTRPATVELRHQLGRTLEVDRDELSASDQRLLARLDGETAPPTTSPVSDIASTLSDAEVSAAIERIVPGTEAVALGGELFAVVGASSTELLDVPGITWSQEDGRAIVHADPFQSYQWHLDNTGQQPPGQAIGTVGVDLDWTEASEVTTGSGIVVAVIDTVIDTTHPDLASRLWRNPDEICGSNLDNDGNGYAGDCRGWNFIGNDADPHEGSPDAFHATHVAGSIAAPRNGVGVVGVAPDVRIMPLAVARGNNPFPTSRVTRAINYAVDNGAHIINASLGTSPGAPYDWAMSEAIARAEAAGVLFVAAAGNSNVDIDDPAQRVYPAAFTHGNVLTVGASNNVDARSTFSNYGATRVHLTAPGTMVLAPNAGGGYLYASGTSMSAPLVSGVAALVAQALQTTDASILRSVLTSSAVPVLAWQGHSATGGKVSAGGALGLVGDGLTVGFSDLGTIELDDDTAQVTTTVTLNSSVSAPVAVTLGVWHENALHGVTDLPVALTGADAASVSTDDEGSFVVRADAVDTATFTLGASLPAGHYAWIVEQLGVADRVSAGTFSVGTTPAPTPVPPPSDPTPPPPGATLPPDGDSTPPPTAGAPVPPDDGTTPPPSGSDIPPPSTDPTSPPPSGDATPPAPDDQPPPPPSPDDTPPPSDGTTPPAPDEPTPPPTTTPPSPDGTTPPAPDGPTPPPTTPPSPDGTTPPLPDDPTSPVPPADDTPPPDDPTTPPTPGTTSPPSPTDPTTPPAPETSSPPAPTPAPGSSVVPDHGIANDLVLVMGTWPSGVRIHFGENPAYVPVITSFYAMVQVPFRADAGAVDVVVRDAAGVEFERFPAAFTYTAGGGGTPPADQGGTTPPPPSGGGTTPLPPPDQGGTTPPDGGGTAPLPPPDPGEPVPPPDQYGTTPPPPGDDTTPLPPPQDGTTLPPDQDGTTPPSDGDGATPPPPTGGGTTPVPPDQDQTTPPPPDDGTTAPPDASPPPARTSGGPTITSTGLRVIRLSAAHPGSALTAAAWPVSCWSSCTGMRL